MDWKSQGRRYSILCFQLSGNRPRTDIWKDRCNEESSQPISLKGSEITELTFYIKAFIPSSVCVHFEKFCPELSMRRDFINMLKAVLPGCICNPLTNTLVFCSPENSIANHNSDAILQMPYLMLTFI